MDNNRKFQLEQQTKRRYFFLRFEQGCKSLFSNKWKIGLLLAYIGLALFLWFFRVPLFELDDISLLGNVKRLSTETLLCISSVTGLIGLIMLFGMPFGSKSVHNNLRRIGFVNSAGETPLLIAKYTDKDNHHVTVLDFIANGIPLTEWENKREKLEAALDIFAVKITAGKTKRHILLYMVAANSGLPQMIYWDDRYLSSDSVSLVLGESLLGRVLVNLSKIPHILLGGSTGSGKSVLLKLLLMQCIKKNMVVFVADLKGGVDFPGVWHNKCKILVNEDAIAGQLIVIIAELERRKKYFHSADCANLDEYNSKMGMHLSRIIFSCDEVAELLDKTGRSKEDKERIATIEANLSTIARQGRAFGIHLILATQRPDANILSGQIRNNIDFRVCGRADNVLSQIILDSTAASEQIPKDAQGRFITHDGTVFQGYLFDEKTAFDKGGGCG